MITVNEHTTANVKVDKHNVIEALEAHLEARNIEPPVYAKYTFFDIEGKEVQIKEVLVTYEKVTDRTFN